MKLSGLIALVVAMAGETAIAQTTNSLGMKLATVPAGRFYMGSERDGEDVDENPVHRVTITYPFKMAVTEVTNAQYEAFDPAHKALRGKFGFSKEDDEAVIFVNYQEAVAFCEWLSKKEGKNYRLPTEAEWEYACRAGTLGDYHTEASLSSAFRKNQKTDVDPTIVSLKVGATPANKFGLYDMHGNVEEWCVDWYGPYQAGEQTDPVGAASGLYRVTRGGSHGTPSNYLRSANRMAMIPEDKHWQLGFRIVEAPFPTSKPTSPAGSPRVMKNVSQSKFQWKSLPKSKPIFLEPLRYVNKPVPADSVPFYKHNHCPAVTWLPNGDLLAAWFSTNQESGREMTIIASRLRAGQDQWDTPSEFFKVPDRNMTGTSLLHDGKGTIYFMNGVETDGYWRDLAMVLRKSTDNGATWSTPVLADPEHQPRNQVIGGMIRTKEGWLIQPSDSNPSSTGGTALHISKDNGKTWQNPYLGPETKVFTEDEKGGLIAGIHAGVVQLNDGSLLALGRGNDIIPKGSELKRMPMSISTDLGKSWSYSATEFPPIAGGQRLVLYKLNEGPLLLVSFTHYPEEQEESKKGMVFTDKAGNSFKGYGMYAAVSFDDGKTWPVKKLLTDGKERYLNGGAHTGPFETSKTRAEPRGYLAVTQSPDNIIHLLSSSLHYRFNLDWLNIKPNP
jgi:sulfatase modifying factor 1